MYISLSVPYNLTQAISFNKRNNPNILKIFFLYFSIYLLTEIFTEGKRKYYVLVVNIYDLNTVISV